MTGFIWGRDRHKLHLSTVQHPKHLGGAALPDLFLYYISGQLKLLRSWFNDASLPDSEAHLAYSLDIPNMWPLLEFPHMYYANSYLFINLPARFGDIPKPLINLMI